MAFNLGDSLAALLVRIGADTTPLRKAIENIGRDIAPLGDKMEQVGRRLTTGITLPLAAAGAASVKAAIDFESAFAGVRKTVDATESEFASLRKGIQNMSKELPTSANEIAGVAEAAGQLGIATPHILSFSRTMVDLGETTNLSATAAATALARFANVTGMAQDDFDKLGSAIVALGNNFATTEAEIVEMSLRLAGAGRQVGLAESEILAFATALSSVGVEAQAGGTAFSKLFAQINSAVSRGGADLEGFARVAGMSAEAFATAFREDAAGATTAFVQGLGSISEQGGDTLGVLDKLGITEIRMRDALLRSANAGDILSDAIRTSNEEWDRNNALTNEAAQRYNTTAARLEVVRNKVTAAAVSIGEELLPAVEASADAVGAMADALSDMDAPLKRVVIGAGTLVAAMGPLALLVGKVANSIGTLTKGLAILGRFGAFGALAGISQLATRDRIDPEDIFREPKGETGIERYFNGILGRMEEVEKRFKSFGTGGFSGALDRGLAAGGGSIVIGSVFDSLSASAERAAREANNSLGTLEETIVEISDTDFRLNFEPPEDVLSSLYEVAGIQREVAYEFEEQAARRIDRLREIGKVQQESFKEGMVEPNLPEGSLEKTIEGMQKMMTQEELLRRGLGELQDIGAAAFDGVTQAIGDSIAGFESFGRAIKRIMRGVLADIVAVIAKTVILKGIMAVFGVAPGDGSFGGSVVGALVGAPAPQSIPTPQIAISIRPSISMGELQFHLDQHNQTQL